MSPSLKAIDKLLLNNFKNIHIYDEILSINNKYDLISRPVHKHSCLEDILSNCELIILGNDQESYLNIDFKKYKTKIIYDFRNQIKKNQFNILGNKINIIKIGENEI
jgi:UDP-N-acetyl-D-mannosaminuronate dehydrogenase